MAGFGGGSSPRDHEEKAFFSHLFSLAQAKKIETMRKRHFHKRFADPLPYTPHVIEDPIAKYSYFLNGLN